MTDGGNVLVVAYNFPPGGGVGMFRVAKFVKYLPRFGWEPHVLTLPVNDSSETRQFGSIAESVDHIYRADVVPKRPFPYLDGLRWLPTVLLKGRSILRNVDIDVVYYTGGPFTQLCAAPILGAISDVPYVIDLRDPWTFETFPRDYIACPPWAYYPVARKLEPPVLERAASVITVTPQLTETYERLYPRLDDKLVTIPNGFDSDDFPESSVERDEASQSPFHLVCAGKFALYQDPNAFLEALERFARDHPECLFTHFGHPEPEFGEAVSRHGLDDVVRFGGYVSKRELAVALENATVGIAASGDNSVTATTKIFDYIACNLPILAIGPSDGALAEIVSPFDGGYTTENDADQIYRTLHELYAARRTTLGSAAERSRYDRKTLTGELAAVLRESSR